MNRRPKYLQDMDEVQDAIDDLSHTRDGVNIQQIMARTNLSYGAVQQAAAKLRSLGRISSERRSRVIYFFPR